MKKLKVGIIGGKFNTWDGGIDFISMIAEGLSSVGSVEEYLIVDKDTLVSRLYYLFGNILKMGFKASRTILKEKKDNNKKLIKTFSSLFPDIKIISYKKTENRFCDNRDKRLIKLLKNNGIDIIIPSMDCDSPDFEVPRVGYIYDFQHKYLKEYFTEDNCKKRDAFFEQQIRNSKDLVVNAISVKNDIEKFFPGYDRNIIVLPFRPFQYVEPADDAAMEKYDLPKKYFSICNQFWMHKSHITAFEALEKLYLEGRTDIHIVCTGILKDDRNPAFAEELKSKIQNLTCKDNIHILGFVPKADQLSVIKKSMALIQPTLFEGGPGGGSTYNAISLGVPCLISDIPVNREIKDQDNIYFFEAGNSSDLADLMLEHEHDTPLSEEQAAQRRNKNRREFGEILYKELRDIVEKQERNIE